MFLVTVLFGMLVRGATELTVDQIDGEISVMRRELSVRQERLTDSCSIWDYSAKVRNVNGTNVWTDALQAALDEHEIVRIPARREKYYFDKSVILPSDRRIEATGATVSLVAGTQTLLLRTASAADGTLMPIPAGGRISNVSIVGGRWEDCCSRRMGYGKTGRFDLTERKPGNFFGVSTFFYLGNVDYVCVKDVTFRRCGAFAIQSGNGSCHVYENIRFDNCFADGIHLNGNLERIHCRHVHGNVGDDLVALNAFDWQTSSVNYGPQRLVVCEDIRLDSDGRKTYPAIRIQPAKYRYADGSVVDCSIFDVVFRHVRGIRTFKMYLQTPPYRIGAVPEWAEVGSGGNLNFADIAIDLSAPIDLLGGYAAGDPITGHYGAFEFGANLTSVRLRDITIRFNLDQYPLGHLGIVGPKSAVLPSGDGGPGLEVFDPYVSCRVENLEVSGLTVVGKEPESLISVSTFKDINRDGRSTGAGAIGHLRIGRK